MARCSAVARRLGITAVRAYLFANSVISFPIPDCAGASHNATKCDGQYLCQKKYLKVLGYMDGGTQVVLFG